MPLRLKVAYARQTFLETDLQFHFVGGRAFTPDGIVRALKRVNPDAADLCYGQSVRAAVEVRGRTVTGSLLLRAGDLDEPNAFPLEFTPDPTGKNADAFN